MSVVFAAITFLVFMLFSILLLVGAAYSIKVFGKSIDGETYIYWSVLVGMSAVLWCIWFGLVRS